jgi:hypothetical protein
MKTDSWVERVIIQELARSNDREQHGYKTRSKRTGEFEWGCAKIEREVATAEGRKPPDLFDAIESTYQDEVADALDKMKQAELITEVRQIPSDRMNHDQESVWELTEEGLREAQLLNDAWLRETVELAQKYGKVPNG